MPHTYRTKADAQAAWALVAAEMAKGRWIDPELSGQTFGSYAETWVAQRDLSEGTRQLYRLLLRRHITPYLGHLALRQVTAAEVRRWRTGRIEAGVGASTLAKSYSLVRSVMTTAVDDELVPRNPCRIKGAGVDPTPERSVLTMDQVAALAEGVDRRWRLLVLLACFGHLRFGELMGLVVDDFDLDTMTVHVRRSVAEVSGRLVVKTPKSGKSRSVALPPALRPEIEAHLDAFAEPDAPRRVFVGEKGGMIRRSNWAVIWRRARDAAGVPDSVHLHDLRHTGNHFAARSGASTRELMARMGHSSMRAALIYQHATEERDRAVAAALDAVLTDALGAAGDGQAS
ncbi:tyrosine-type recombinase/integrase [Arsenicicoccus dermatophilus]